MISGPMTGALSVYSALFMRFAWRVQPRNYILLACHTANGSVQVLSRAQSTRVSNEPWETENPFLVPFVGPVVYSFIEPRSQQPVLFLPFFVWRVSQFLNSPLPHQPTPSPRRRSRTTSSAGSGGRGARRDWRSPR